MTGLVTSGPGYLGSRLIREIPDHLAFSGEEIRIMDNFRQPRFHALWDLPSYADYDFVEGDVHSVSRTLPFQYVLREPVIEEFTWVLELDLIG